MPNRRATSPIFHMRLSQLPKELLARTVVEPMLATGHVPRQECLRRVIHWTLANRDLRFPTDHPLKVIEDIPEWDNTFALSRSSLLWLWARLVRLRPSAILELGSGRTTFALATFAREQEATGGSAPKIVTVEAEGEWLDRTRAILERHDLHSFVDFSHAPALLTPDLHGYDLTKASLEPLFAQYPADFVLIDGPSGGQGRFGTLPSVYHLLSETAEIFLDDCGRPQEQETLRSWARKYDGELHCQGIVPTVGGLGWLSRNPQL